MTGTRRANGEGSISKAPDGRWHAFLGFGVKAGGRRDRRHVSGRTRKEVADKLRGPQSKRDAGLVPSDGRPVTVGEWLTLWLDPIAAAKVGPSTARTYRTYRTLITTRIVPALGHHRLDRLQPEHVAAFYRQASTPTVLIRSDGTTVALKALAPASILQCHRVLSRALKVATQRGRIARNVCTLVEAPSVDRAEVEPLTVVDARRVLTAAVGGRNAPRWTVALAIGLRQGEALGLCWNFLNLDRGALRARWALQRQTGTGLVLVDVKCRAGRRTVVLPDELVNALRDHRRAQVAERLAAGSTWVDGPHEGFVFAQPNGKPIDPRRDWQDWRTLLDAAGVREARLHDARHTAATILLAQGVPARVVQQILGHSSIALTLGTYAHVAEELEREAAQRMSAALFGTNGTEWLPGWHRSLWPLIL